VVGDEVWVTSIPIGAEVYIQLYTPDQVPSHANDPAASRGTTPARFTLPPGSYWLELALEADVFESYFSPPYDDAQFEQDGAASEALLFRPFAPGEKRRVLRYYRLEKQAQQGQTLIALFHPRGAQLERVVALYPQGEQYRFAPDALVELLQRVQVPLNTQETFLTLLKRGGKAFWSVRDEYAVALELRQDTVEGGLWRCTLVPPCLIHLFLMVGDCRFSLGRFRADRPYTAAKLQGLRHYHQHVGSAPAGE
jgi:hypothetical protein